MFTHIVNITKQSNKKNISLHFVLVKKKEKKRDFATSVTLYLLLLWEYIMYKTVTTAHYYL